ncbi:hypothetical protein GmRootA79_10800 [Acidovorax sp. A79]
MLLSSAWGQVNIPPGSSIDLSAGDIDFSCLATTNQGDLILGTGTLTTGSLTLDSGSTVSGTGSTLNVSGDLAAIAPTNLGTSTIVVSDICAPGTQFQLSGNIVVRNLVFISTTGAPATFVLPVGTNITVTGSVTLGTPGSPVILAPSGSGTAVITLAPGATLQNPSGSVIPPTVSFGPIVTGAASIPTLDTYGLLLLSLLLGGFALGARRRGPQPSARHLRS